MAFRALTGLMPEWFAPERFELTRDGELKELEEQPDDVVKFKIMPLNGMQQAMIAKNIQSAAEIACRECIVGWENLNDSHGQPVEFFKGKILEYIPFQYQQIIGAKIMELSTLSKAQEKNS